MNQKHIVVVLGMHRSGTSAITRGLKVLGVELGSNLIPPNENVNAKGFWEDADVNAINIELLGALGCDWHTLRPLLANELALPLVEKFRLQALHLLQSKLSDTNYFGLKDPRLAKLLPFWKDVFSRLNIKVSYVIACRNPMSVAHSLFKRDGFAFEKTYQLWLDHMLASLVGTQGESRVIVDYDLLMEDAAQQLNRVAKYLHLKFDVNSQAFAEYKNEFLEDGLRHTRYHSSDLALDRAAPSQVNELYNALLSMATDLSEHDSPAINTMLKKMMETLRQNHPILRYISDCEQRITEMTSQNTIQKNRLIEQEKQASELNTLLAERDSELAGLNQATVERENQLANLNQVAAERMALISEIRSTVATQESQIRTLQETIQEIYQSRSWRVTRMMRYLGRIRRKVGDVLAVIRRLLQDESLLTLIRKVLKVWRREGLRGMKVRVRQQHYLATQTMAAPSIARPSAALGFALEPAAIARRLDGHYALAPSSRGYTYIEPQRPVDLDARLSALKSAPLFSIVVPLYNTTPELLEAVLTSVQKQWYPHWQLVLADDASPAEETRKALAQINHPQIKLLRLENNQGIAGATNAALEAAGGDFIVFMDHDDELTVDCLYELALCIEREQPDFIYSDEDKITEHGEYSEPHFKPDWSPDTMMSTMFTCHVSCVRRSLLEKVGGLRSQYDGCQDWDFVLRVSEQTDRIAHIPKVLYHWRIIPASIASDIAAKPYVLEASRRVREDALQRRGLAATVEPLPQMMGYFRVAYELQGSPLISIIIPTRDNEKVLRRCIDSILQRTSYRRFEMVVLDNGSIEPAAVAYLQQLKEVDGVTVIRHDAPFNFSELNNIGARIATGELLLFLNDDTEVLQEDWLERLGGFAQLAHIGAVGAKLLYPGQRQVQHAGILNLEDGPGHAFLLQDCDSPGYYMRNLLEYNWLAVTGACLMVARDKFNAIEGFSESLPVAYNDIDLCMRLYDAGLYNVVCQAVRLTHHESASRGIDHIDPPKMARLKRELAYLYERNPEYFQHDPFHNPNLHPNGIHFEVPV
jgi:O-antigen biosynthesis protein